MKYTSTQLSDDDWKISEKRPRNAIFVNNTTRLLIVCGNTMITSALLYLRAFAFRGCVISVNII